MTRGDQTGVAIGTARTELSLLEEDDASPALGKIIGGANTDNATAYDDYVCCFNDGSPGQVHA
jgi:hypothetical protein